MDHSHQLPIVTENFSAGNIPHAVAPVCVVPPFLVLPFHTVHLNNSVFILKYSGVQ